MIQKKILTPFQKFVQLESFSGILLILSAIVALVWANSPYWESYETVWQYKLGFTSPHLELNKPLILWINDGLMAIFFFLIGLEIKREFLIGELNSLKKIAFPLFGALGGVSVPVLLFFVLNQNPDTLKGWGIPMATDIAFSLAILNLLGNRVPLSLKIFLTAFAIVDDIVAVIVIALFYSGTIIVSYLLIAGFLLAALYILAYRGYYSKYIHLFLGIVVWVLFLKSGIHPTLAGVLLAFAVPIRQKIHTPEYLDNLGQITEGIRKAHIVDKPILSKEQIAQIDTLESWTEQYQSPLQHLEHNLHGWVAYLIIPIFALANAGVSFGQMEDIDYGLVRNLIICLLIGNSIGITTIIYTARKLGLITVPEDIGPRHVIGVSFLAGIGFTMSIFIAGLAFEQNPVFIDSAKTGVLIGSLLSAIIGYLILRITGRRYTANP